MSDILERNQPATNCVIIKYAYTERMQNIKEEIDRTTFMESCEINYVPMCGRGLKLAINLINNQRKLGILAHI